MSTLKNKPIDTLRDGALKATIWANFGEKGTFYSMTLRRTYTCPQTGNPKDGDSFSGTDPLRLQRLIGKADDRMQQLYSQDRQA